MEKIRYQSVEITRSNGDSGYSEESFNLDHAYNRITGVRAYVQANGGQASQDFALKDKDEMYHNLTPSQDWAPTVDFWYKPLNIDHRGQQMTIGTKLPGTNTSESKYVFVFKLERIKQ
jgi:hypothetical protein